jgi:thiazole/oxazole-forming peptide maturase SagD family component
VQEILNWHPKFKVFTLQRGDMLLLSEMSSFSLPKKLFSALTLIDGKRSINDIITILQERQQDVATFLYQVSQFKQQQLLVDMQQADNKLFIHQSTLIPQLLVSKAHYSVVNLTANGQKTLSVWLDYITKLDLAKLDLERLDVEKNQHITFILCDDLLNPTLLGEVEKHEAVCLIKITGEQIQIVSLLGLINATKYLLKLQTRLKHNNPTLGLIATCFPDADLMPAYIANQPFTESLLAILQEQLMLQINSRKKQLTVINSNSGVVEQHPISLINEHQADFKTQILSKITLSPCPAHFNKDGGSRTVCPQQTVDNITPFISPITGLITHIQALPDSFDKSVKIYTTAFFKKPAINRLTNIDNDSFVHQCMGKGVSHSQSQASALCEAIERFSAHFQGDEPLYLSKPDVLAKRRYDFQQLVPYSALQYQQFNDENHPDSLLKQAAIAYQGEAIHWLPTWSLTEHEQVHLPLTHCLANIPFDDDKFARWHSNGCAAGNTLEEAILQALFELIERDAVAIWWYNRIERPAFDLTRLDKDNLQLIDETLADHDYWVLDLTHDIEVPVMIAIGQHKQNGGLSFGFGCHLQSDLAAQRALTELCQLIPIRNQKDAPFDFDAVQQGAFLFPSGIIETVLGDVESSGDIKLDIEALVEKLQSLGLETLALDYSRAPLPIKSTKVFVPGLCHIWPQLDNQRLYQTPVKLGWLDKAYCEQTINQQALYV